MCKNKAEFSAAVAMYRKLSADKKAAEDALEIVKADMEKYLKKRGTPGGKDGKSRIVHGDGYKATLIPLERISFDEDKLKVALGDDLNDYKKSSPYNRIYVG